MIENMLLQNGNFFEKIPMINMDELSPYLDGGCNRGVMQVLSRGNRNEKLHYFTSLIGALKAYCHMGHLKTYDVSFWG